MFRVEKGFCNKKDGVLGVLGWSLLETLHFEGPELEYPLKDFQNVWLSFFLKSLYEKSNTFKPLLNPYFRAICYAVGPWDPPPGDKGLI